MPRQKRLYCPKVKGCAQCAQRRISCDRKLPECGKCSSRGLECSGFGDQRRYRFVDSVNFRGKWTRNTIQDFCEKRETGRTVKGSKEAFLEEETDSEVEDLTLPLDGTGCQPLLRRSNYEEISFPGYNPDSKVNQKPPDTPCSFICPDETLEHQLPIQGASQGNEVGESSHSSDQALFLSSGPTTSESLLNHLPSWKRRLLLHFSDHIASEMLAIDGGHNGWRYIVLPLAYQDELVLDAVLTFSAFHMEGSAPSPQTLYNEAISGHQRRSNLANGTIETRQATLIAVLVLLGAAMVTGRDDYATILGMLHSATNIFGGEEQLSATELGAFLVRQIRKMRVYAAPHISEIAGSETLATEAHWDHCFDCIRYCAQDQFSSPPAVAAITNVMQLAHDKDYPPKDPNSQIERFKQILEALPEN